MVRRLLANWELKLLSVVIAFALWLVVVGGGKSQLAVAAVVEYTGLDGDLVLVGRPRDTVDVAGRYETVTQSVGLVLPESMYLTDQQRVLVTVEISRRSR